MDLFSAKIAYAAAKYDPPAGVVSFVGKVETEIIKPIITILTAVAVAVFLYGVVEFLLNQSNEEKKSTGKSHMLWGIVGLTIIVGYMAIQSWLS